jgi:PAS domain S-box-containing protein
MGSALCYGLLARIGLKLVLPPHNIAVFWPPNGALLAILLVTNKRRWPAVFAGVPPGHYLLVLLGGGRELTLDVVYALANMIELGIAAWLIRRICGPRLTFRSMREVLSLILSAMVLACGVSASISSAITIYYFEGLAFMTVWRSWWMADAMGVLLITPMVVTLMPSAGRFRGIPGAAKKIEAAILFGLLAVVSEIIFGSSSGGGQEQIPMMYVVFPFVLWAAVRFGPREASIASFMVSMIAIVNASLSRGPRFFGPGGAATTAYWIQIYLAVVVLSCLVMAAVWSERSDSANMLRKEQDYSANILATAPAIICGLGSDGRVISINPAVTTVTGYAPTAVEGKDFWKLFFPGQLEKEAERARIAIESDPSAGCEAVLQAADKSTRTVAFRAARMREGDERGTDLILIGNDITARRQAEEELRSTLEALEKRVEERTAELNVAKIAADTANKAKSEFLANMSHELRTPLNGILGYAQILRRSKKLGQSELREVDVIAQSGTHLLMLINDVLDLAKVESQVMELHPNEFHFLSFLRSTAEMCRIRAEQKGLAFVYTPVSPLPVGVYADERRLRQVLINLIGNAIKFTEKGAVSVTVSAVQNGKEERPGGAAKAGEKRKAHTIRFEIEDTGCGISADSLDQIFLPFRQVGDKKQRSEGTGLGLAISQRLVTLMGSSIAVKSEPGKGSVFSIDLTLLEASNWTGSATRTAQGLIVGYKGRRQKLLVVDDKWENRAVLVSMLEPLGFETATATDGQEGIQKAAEGGFDLVITDLVMPVVDGWEMMQRLRKMPRLAGLTIFASSASVYSADQDKSLAAGADEFLPKPLQLDDLLAKIHRHLRLEWIYEQPGERAVEEAQPSTREHPNVVTPPVDDLKELLNLVHNGLVNQIQKYVEKLEKADPKLAPFMKHIHHLLLDFRLDEMDDFLKKNIADKG